MYSRPGHILSATNMPSSDLLDEVEHYRSYDELDMMHDGDRSDRVITYCGGGGSGVIRRFHDAQTRLH